MKCFYFAVKDKIIKRRQILKHDDIWIRFFVTSDLGCFQYHITVIYLVHVNL